MVAKDEAEFPVCGDEVVGWSSSPSARFRIFVRSGYRHDGIWHATGLIHIQPMSGHPTQVRGYHRPWEAVINDEGYSVVSDHGHPDQPVFLLLFIAPDGSIITQYPSDAPAESLTISPDGLSVVLLLPPHVACYELRTGLCRWSIPEPAEGRRIRLVIEDAPYLLIGEPYRVGWSDYILKVDFAGQILERWPRSGYEAITFGETARKTGDWSEAERYFLLAANSQISDSFRARAFRFLGEVYIETNRSAAAIGALRSAIGIDPHCGVKRVLASLERNDTTRGSHTSHIRS